MSATLPLIEPEQRETTSPAASSQVPRDAKLRGRATARLERQLLAQIGRASRDFGMLEEGDRVMVGVSGGKDSYSLLHLLRSLQRRAPFRFEVIAVTLDQGHPGFPVDVLRGFYEEEGYDYRIVYRDTYSIVQEKIPEGQIACPLCSRLRRGILYRTAQELGATKIALGHHRDDLIETLMLNLLYSGQLKSMAVKLRSDDGNNVVIRPLAYAAEEDIARFARRMEFPIIPCDLCGTQENLKRQEIKALIARLNADNPKVKGNMVAALSRVVPSHLLDRGLLQRLGADDPDASRVGIASAPEKLDATPPADLPDGTDLVGLTHRGQPLSPAQQKHVDG